VKKRANFESVHDLFHGCLGVFAGSSTPWRPRSDHEMLIGETGGSEKKGDANEKRKK